MTPVQNEKNKKRRWLGSSLRRDQNKEVYEAPIPIFKKARTLDKGVFAPRLVEHTTAQEQTEDRNDYEKYKST